VTSPPLVLTSRLWRKADNLIFRFGTGALRLRWIAQQNASARNNIRGMLLAETRCEA
jgi:hypothetical protein